MILGVSGDSNELRWVFHSIKELIVIILITGITFTRNTTLSKERQWNNKCFEEASAGLSQRPKLSSGQEPYLCYSRQDCCMMREELLPLWKPSPSGCAVWPAAPVSPPTWSSGLFQIVNSSATVYFGCWPGRGSLYRPWGACNHNKSKVKSATIAWITPWLTVSDLHWSWHWTWFGKVLLFL